MDDFLKVILVIGILAVVCFIGYLAWLAEKKRRDALTALAGRLGWQFDPAHDKDHDDQYAHFEIFRRGHGRAAYNTLIGDLKVNGRSCLVKMGDFTYKVTTHTGKSTSTTTYRFSYVILHLPFANVPDLLIRREGMFDKLAGAFGFDDIDFESAEFSRKFHVKSPDKKFAYDVIHARMMEFLLVGEAAAIDIERGRCCVSDGQKRWEPQQFEDELAWLQAFLNLWPEHVTARLDS